MYHSDQILPRLLDICHVFKPKVCDMYWQVCGILLIISLQVFPNYLKWTTFHWAFCLEKVWTEYLSCRKQNDTSFQKQPIPWDLTELGSIFERLLVLAQDGNARVLILSLMKPLGLVLGLSSTGVPCFSYALETPELRIKTGAWPMKEGTLHLSAKATIAYFFGQAVAQVSL